MTVPQVERPTATQRGPADNDDRHWKGILLRTVISGPWSAPKSRRPEVPHFDAVISMWGMIPRCRLKRVSAQLATLNPTVPGGIPCGQLDTALMIQLGRADPPFALRDVSSAPSAVWTHAIHRENRLPIKSAVS